MADNIVRNVLQWVTDQPSLNKTVADANKVGVATTAQAKRQADAFTEARRITSEYDSVLGKLGATASANLTLLEQKMRDSARTTEVAGREVQDLTTLYDALEQQAKEAAAATDKVAQKSGSGVNVGQIAGRTAGLGAVLGGEAGGAAFPVIAQVIQLGAAFGPLGVILGSVAAASRILTADAQKTTDAIKKQSAAFLELQISLPTTTRDELQKRLDSDQAALATAEAFARSASANVVKYVQEHPEFTYPVTGIVAESLAGMGGTLGGLTETADGANTRVRDLQDGIANLLITLAGLPEETNDLAAAEERLAASRQASAEVQQAQLGYADAFVRGQSLTTEQRLAEIASLQQQKTSYEDLIANGNLSGDTVQALNDKIDALDNQMAGLEEASSKYADSLAREEAAKQALTDRNDNLLELLDQEAEARTKANEIQAKIDDVRTEYENDLLVQAYDYGEKRREIEAKAGDKAVENAKDAAERIAKIERDANRSRTEAVGNRDADAYRQANIRAKDALEDADAASKKANETTAKAQAEQLATLKKGYEKQQQTTFNAASKQISTLQQSLAAQQFIVQSSQSAQLFLTQSGMNAAVTTTQNGWSIITNTFSVGMQNLINATARQVSNGSSSFPTLTSSIGPASASNILQFNRAFDARWAETTQINGRSSPR